MAVYGAAYELTFNREAGGAAFHPELCRLYKSITPWAGTTTLTTTLSRGYIPYPASGQGNNIRRVHGISSNLAPGSVILTADALTDFAFVDGVLTTNANVPVIRRCGYDAFFGRGRAAPGDFLAATGNLLTALEGGDVASTAELDCYADAGYFDVPTIGPDRPWQTSDGNTLWTSHLGIYDFLDDAIDEDTRQNEIFYTILGRGNEYRLPNQTVVQDCSYAAVSPEGMIWILPADYGTNVSNNVATNTADSFRNHPGVFVRREGAAYLRALTRRWRDQQTIVATTVGQPIGIYQVANPVTSSKWLIVVDGIAEVVYLQHPANTDFRRPVDIWNNVIVPLIRSTGSNGTRVTTTDLYGAPIGTETRWQYLSYARFLGPEGDTTQTNATPPG